MGTRNRLQRKKKDLSRRQGEKIQLQPLMGRGKWREWVSQGDYLIIFKEGKGPISLKRSGSLKEKRGGGPHSSAVGRKVHLKEADRGEGDREREFESVLKGRIEINQKETRKKGGGPVCR